MLVRDRRLYCGLSLSSGGMTCGPDGVGTLAGDGLMVVGTGGVSTLGGVGVLVMGFGGVITLGEHALVCSVVLVVTSWEKMSLRRWMDFSCWSPGASNGSGD